MAILENGKILTGVGYCLWNGISRPEELPGRKPGEQGTVKYTLSFAFPANAPEYGELHQAIQQQETKEFPHGLPGGFRPAFTTTESILDDNTRAPKYPEIPGHVRINTTTYGTMPSVFDVTGRELSAAEIERALYTGAKIRLQVSPRVYDSNGNKGSGFWLTGVQVIDATAPRFAAAGEDFSAAARNAFAAHSVQGVPVAAAMPGAIPATPAAPVAPPVPGAPAHSAPTAPAAPVAPQAPVNHVAPNYGAVNPPNAPAGHAAASAPGQMPTPAPAAPMPPSAPTAPISPSKQMTAAAQFSYDQYIASGWNDAQLIAAGLLAG